jgi:putative hydrolase of the HAD superfamily
MALRAVAFDLDGTLYPFRDLVLRAAAFGVRHPDYATRFRRVREQIRGVRPISDFRQTQAELFAASAGLGLEEARSWIERRVYGELVATFRSVRPYRGLSELLDEIRGRGLALAVLSDLPVAEKLRYLGLEGRFAVAMCSEESGYLKPSPEPFVLLAQRLGLAPSDILFVGDSYEQDIVGAHDAGLMSAHLSARRRRGSVADLSFSRYERLKELLPTL